MTIQSRLRMLLDHFQHSIPQDAEKPDGNLIAGPKLNLGSGWDNRAGWINIDLHSVHNPDIVCDVTCVTSLQDNYANYILAQDILEHIHRDKCLTALREWNRILRPNGHLEVRVPDVIAIVDLMQRTDRDNWQGHLLLLQCLFGTQGYGGDFHLNGFTEIYLRGVLERSGFEVVYFGHKDEWLFDVVAQKIDHRPPDPLLRSASDTEFLISAYQRYLRRDPDADGLAHFASKLASGTPREVVVALLEKGEMQ